jgi:hypothetical protein
MTPTPRRSNVRAAAIVVAALVATAGCSERPDGPRRDNPLDPKNPGAAENPFALTATQRGSVVDLDWQDVEIAESAGYAVYRSRTAESVVSAPDTILAIGLEESFFRDQRPLHDGVSYYLVTVRNARGEESFRSEAVTAEIELPPHIEILNASRQLAATTPTRDVRVRFLSGAASAFVLSNALDGEDLASPDTFPPGVVLPDTIPPDSIPYVGLEIPWRLDPAASSDDTLRVVFGRVIHPGGEASPILSDTVRASAPAFQAHVGGQADSVVTTGRRTIALGIRVSNLVPTLPAGADSFEVSFSREFTGAWQAFPDSTSGVTVPVALRGPDLDSIFVRVRNSIGLAAVDAIAVKADSLEGGALVLNNVAAPTEIAVTRFERVNVHVTGARATAICLANEPVPPCAAFDSLAGTVRADWPLPSPPGAGVRVNAILANEWRPEGAGVLSDTITIQPDSVRVTFRSATRRDSTIAISRLGTTELLLGAATTIAGGARGRNFGASIASVALFELAEGGAIEIPGVTLREPDPGDSVDVVWEAAWQIPEADADGMATLAAAATDSVGTVARDTVRVVLVAPEPDSSRAARRGRR